MGCICSKGIPPEEQSEVKREKSTTKSSRRHVASSRREVVTILDIDSTPANDEEDVKDVKSKTPKLLIAHQKRATVDVGDSEPVLRIANVPNGFEAEHVAAGWPSWLISVAAEAVKGWVPRRADTFEKLDKIGQGTYSSVYRARDLETGKIVALKKVRFVNMDPESVRFMAREIHILRRLDHPNIVKLEGLITSRMSASLYLIFEYMEHDLAGLAATPGIKFTESQVKCYMKQLLDGLEHCHSRGILHRDIKGSNLLIDDNGILRIADFGLATPFTPDQKQPLTSRVVTLWYRPPELLLGATEYGVAVDLWSTGCILAELLSGKPIMPGRTEVEQMHKIFKLCGSPSEEYWRKSKLPHATIFKPQRPYRRCLHETFKDFPPTALSLLDTLLAMKPEDRGTTTSALNSAFFTTKPYACDPSSLPKYPPSKEFDAKVRDEEARRKNGTTKEHGTDLVSGSRATRRVADTTTSGSSLQKTQTQSTQRKEKYGYRSVEPASHLNGSAHNGISHSGPLMHPSAFGTAWNKKVKDGDFRAAPSRTTSTVRGLNGPECKAQRSYMPHGGGEELAFLSGLLSARTSAKSDNHRERSKQHHWPEHRLDVTEASEMQEWTNQIIDVPSTSRNDGERIIVKEPTMGYGAKKNRIHYSGPLMLPGGNLEEMLKEHERQIQQAVRKARLDKAKTKKNIADQRPV